ncbi:MAG: group II intron reverse transcriptase/maturase [Methanosarcinaceae archaeon]|nr:group II intron reverse transcriptase/maturase [Methanosarcinaceae archaeon]
MNVSNSMTPTGERLTDTRRKIQWKDINWKIVTDSVNWLQVRITKAVNKEKWQLVKRLQYMLTHSFYAKMLAIRRVTQNKGTRTAGVDGIRWTTPEAKMNAVLNLSDKKYKAKPLRRVYIEKYGKKEKRPLSIPTMHDRAMQALYAFALSPVAEATADRTSFGFRKNRSTHDAYAQAFNCLSKKNSAQWLLEGDIKGCFDNINHEWLLDNIPMDKSILKQFLKAGFVYNRHLNPSKSGTPQGGIISPILANMALDGIEALIASKYYTSKSGKIYKRYDRHKVNFVRYADDFIVTADTEDTAKEIAELIKSFLKEKGLELSETKTLITHIDTGFDFLGWNFRKYKGKLLIKPSKDSIGKITQKMSDIIKRGKAWKQEDIISILNPIITGWSNYHQSAVSKNIFSKLDDRLWGMLRRWAKRRHPEKSKSWIVKRYWHEARGRKWVFSTKEKELKRFSDTKIVRHPNVKLDKNPYLDKEYFDLRRYKISLRRKTNKSFSKTMIA